MHLKYIIQLSKNNVLLDDYFQRLLKNTDKGRVFNKPQLLKYI